MAGNRPRILIVDDEPEMCQVLERQLSREGYEVRSVVDAGAALVKLTHESFDLVVTDLMMPGMSGTDLLRLIRKMWHDVPVVVLTGRENLGAETTAACLHVSGYLKKGTTSGADLVAAIERVLNESPPG